MKDLSWLNNQALKNMDPKKLAIIIDLLNETEGKNLEQTLPYLLKASSTLKNENLSFNEEETSLIIDLLSKDLSATEKSKFETFKTLMKTMKK